MPSTAPPATAPADQPPTAKPQTAPADGATPTLPTAGGGGQASTSWTPARLALVLVATLGGLFVLALLVLIFKGDLSDQQLFWAVALFALLAGFVWFALFPDSVAVYKQGDAKLVGAPAATVVVFLALWNVAPAQPNQTVQLYLAGGPGAADVPTFSVSYRGTGDTLIPGQKGHAVIQTLPRGESELRVSRVECEGFSPKLEPGEDGLRTYPIKRRGVLLREVTIPMIARLEPADCDPPTPDEVKRLVEQAGLSREVIRKHRGEPKDKVRLTIINGAGVPFRVVLYDAFRAYDDAPPDLDDGFPPVRVTDTPIPLGGTQVFGDFSQFKQPSGWFAVYVRTFNATQNRWEQQAISVVHLFDQLQPRLHVIKASDRHVFSWDQRSSPGVSKN